ncbi:hypothetical protein [Bacteroides pyogenes]|uniref:Uncharacterized protein n=2 Tax=Bacteroides pyogenes TaxID=310300 RepID=W4PD38_9BACE|nr:hypothetical protein [Bacteroides pyogenes]GAE14117.1 hypothetical protein JCM6292_205 [Bacteroides pyogenes JCM 6292]GAE17303.1 hypothetical protein JCM6294_31 [Bacteroides pyogenes DSM 20611 = JCM 6294]MBR8808785.1 hypothetical protein [Bacteroides pyogenes]MCF2707751.1 hypothetical protein [Bacteroides pyogenes]MDY5433664.1 hypothetical protein [Bacteroides pyogenes]
MHKNKLYHPNTTAFFRFFHFTPPIYAAGTIHHTPTGMADVKESLHSAAAKE